MNPNESKHSCSCGGSCSPDRKLTRREFVQCAASSAAIISGLCALPVMAGPFEDNDYLKIIIEDKKLSPEWVRSLFDRGRKQVYSDRKALGHIGMPVGGLFAGTVYLSGDGRLWLWDVFNRDQEGIVPVTITYKGQEVRSRDGARYVEPAPVTSPFAQEFGIRVSLDGVKKDIPLNADGFETVSFSGQYPMGQVDYESSRLPLKVTLRAYSPFIPLNLEDSSLPATLMNYTVCNTSDKTIEVDLYGKLQNPVCMETRRQTAGRLVNTVVKKPSFSAIHCFAEPLKESQTPRQDVVFEDFEKGVYEGWTAEGEAFGAGPVKIKEIPDYQGDVAGQGEYVVNSHASAPGKDITAKDGSVGKLTSRPFTIERNYIMFLIGGGPHEGKTCINLLVDGEVVASATGAGNNRMSSTNFDVRPWQGKTAQLQIVDNFSGSWGNIGVDQIVFTDQPIQNSNLIEQRDFGSMSLALFGSRPNDFAVAAEGKDDPRATGSLDDKLIGNIGTTLRLEPGQSQTVSFAVTWNFPNFYARGVGGRLVGHSYAARFAAALDVAEYMAENFPRLTSQTEKWVATWYDSTLPYWLLDRTMANTSTLATTTCYRFKDGRFWAWEGIGSCEGTCTHVWQYAQAPGRVFPELERIERERVNFGLGQHDDGGIGTRTDLNRSGEEVADDGHCGRILGAYRDHQMSADDAFLRRIWPRVKKAIIFLIEKDGNNDGQIEGHQYNTLDAGWYGKISFLQSLYIAALKAGQAMAAEMGDTAFAARCEEIAAAGAKTIEALYNGEYFIQIEDPAHAEAIGVGPGCYIDQIFGQSWAHQVGLGYIFDQDKQRSALNSLWKYNFVPDIGPFRNRFTQGRWYAMPGDAGLVMCTWPKGGQNPNFTKHWQYGYFNECMSGFEWQVASHMIFEGMLKEGLAVARAIHDRYDASLRNPYNEIECSDHYARAMASYGAFVSVCGFEHHGPKGQIAFSPRLTPEDFKAPFICAEGWGTFMQKRQDGTQSQQLKLHWGRLRFSQMAFDLPGEMTAKKVRVKANGKQLESSFSMSKNRVIVTLEETVQIQTDQDMEIEIQY